MAEDRYDELQRAGCLVGCYWNTLDSPNQRLEHVEGCPNKSTAPPEPREPAAREAVNVQAESELETTLLANPVYLELRQMYCYKGAEFSRPTLEKGWKEIERLEAYSAELRADVTRLEKLTNQLEQIIVKLRASTSAPEGTV